MRGGLFWNLAEMSRGKIFYVTFFAFRLGQKAYPAVLNRGGTEGQISAVYEAVVLNNTKTWGPFLEGPGNYRAR